MSEIKQEDLNLFLKNLSEIANKLGEVVESFSALNQAIQSSPKILKQEVKNSPCDREKVIEEAIENTRLILNAPTFYVKSKGWYDRDRFAIVTGVSVRNHRKTVAMIVDRESGKTVYGTSVICVEDDVFNREIGNYLAVYKLSNGNLAGVPKRFTHFEEGLIPLKLGQVVQHKTTKNIFRIIGHQHFDTVKAQVLSAKKGFGSFPVGHEFECRIDNLRILEDSKDINYDLYINS